MPKPAGFLAPYRVLDLTDHRGLLSVDERGMTTVPGVFAAGDVVNGPLTVVHAVAGAKLAVEGMTTDLGL